MTLRKHNVVEVIVTQVLSWSLTANHSGQFKTGSKATNHES